MSWFLQNTCNYVKSAAPQKTTVLRVSLHTLRRLRDDLRLTDGPHLGIAWGMEQTQPQPPQAVYFARHALLPSGMSENVRIELAADGTFAAVTPQGSPNSATELRGVVLPGAMLRVLQ